MSCNSSIVFDHYMPVDVDGWSRSIAYRCHATPRINEGGYREEISVRIAGDYPFKRLTLVVKQDILSRESLCDTISFDLSQRDDRGITYLDYSQPLRTVVLQPNDSITFTIRHLMDTTNLPSIAAVGVRLIATLPKN